MYKWYIQDVLFPSVLCIVLSLQNLVSEGPAKGIIWELGFTFFGLEKMGFHALELRFSHYWDWAFSSSD